jgi:hypothetical protein
MTKEGAAISASRPHPVVGLQHYSSSGSATPLIKFSQYNRSIFTGPVRRTSRSERRSASNRSNWERLAATASAAVTARNVSLCPGLVVARRGRSLEITVAIFG